MAAYLDLSAAPPVTAADAAALRAGDPTLLKVGQVATLTGAGGSFRKMYGWDPTDVTADDGDLVLKPNSIGGGSPGRWKVLATSAAIASTLLLRDGTGGLGAVDTSARVIHVNKTTGPNAPVPSDIAGISVMRGDVASVNRDFAGWFWEESSSRWIAAFDTLGNDTGLGTPLAISAGRLDLLNASRVSQMSIEATTTASITAAGTVTAFFIGQDDDPSGVGATLTVRAQAGYGGGGGFAGGVLLLAGGAGGIPGTNLNGNVDVELGEQAGGTTAQFRLLDDGAAFFAGRRIGTATYLQALAGDLNFTATAAIQAIATTSMVFRGTSGFFDADTVSWRSNALTARMVQSFSSSAFSQTWDGTNVASVLLNWGQDNAGAGGTFTIRGQQGFAGFAGGDLILAAGLGGTPGTNVNGNVRVKLGTPVSNATGVFYLEREDGTLVMSTYEIAAGIVGMYFGSAGGSSQGIIRGATLGLESSTGLVAVQPATDLYIGHASNRDIFHREGSTTVLTEHLDADSATWLRFGGAGTSFTSVAIDFADTTGATGASMSVKGQNSTHATGAGGPVSIAGGTGLTGGNAFVSGGNGSGTNASGGHVEIVGGNKTGTGKNGNIALHASPSSWQNGERINFLRDATTEPSGNPTAGLFAWSAGGLGTLTTTQLRTRGADGLIDGLNYFSNRTAAPTGIRHFRVEDGRAVAVVTANQTIGVIPSSFFSSGAWHATVFVVVHGFDTNEGYTRRLVMFSVDRRAGTTTLSAVEVLGTGVDSAGQNPTITAALSGADILVRVTQAKAENTHWSIWADVYFNEH